MIFGYDSWPPAHAARVRRARTVLFFHAAASCMRARGVRARRARAYSYKFMKPHGYRFPTAVGTYRIRIDFVGSDSKNIPLGKMQSKSVNGLAKLKIAMTASKISLDPNFEHRL
jgi:hypothetical protein